MAPISVQYAKAQFVLRQPMASGSSFTAGPPIGMIPFLFNPKEYSISLQSDWSPKPAKKSAEPEEFTAQKMRTLSLDMFLDVTDVPQGTVAPLVELLFTTLRPTPASVMMNTPFPPIVMFTWGATPPFVGVVTQVNATMTLFQPTGLPVRRDVQGVDDGVDPTVRRREPDVGGVAVHELAPGPPRRLAGLDRDGPLRQADDVAGDRRGQRHRRPVQRAHRHRAGSSPPPPTQSPSPDGRTAPTNVFEIEVGGMPLSDAVAAALLEARIEDEVNLPDSCELVFSDAGRSVLAAGRFEIGAALTVDVSSEATLAGTRIFDGEITAVEAEIDRDRTLTIVPRLRQDAPAAARDHDRDPPRRHVRRHRRQGRRPSRPQPG